MSAGNQIIIPGFKIIDHIDTGGNSSVYFGQRSRDQVEVVIKVSKHTNFSEEDLKSHPFKVYSSTIYGLKEYDIGRSFNCDFIAEYLQYNNTGNNTYTIMTREMGTMVPYKDHIKLTYDMKISLLKKILFGLNECHNDGIIHLDLKFENILMRGRQKPDGMVDEPLITDFGFSLRVLNVSAGVILRKRFGTHGYMAPEQFSGYYEKRPAYNVYRGADDIWAFGVMAYRLIFEQRLFDSDEQNIFAEMKRKCYRIESFLSKQYPDALPEVVQLMVSTLNWNYNKRLTSRELLELPIFRKSVKIDAGCHYLIRPTVNINPNSSMLRLCLSISREVSDLCLKASIPIYYHYIDLIYRYTSLRVVDRPYQDNVLKSKNARIINLSCFIIAMDYHFETNLGFIDQYMRQNDILTKDITLKLKAIPNSLGFFIYRKHLFETIRNEDDIKNHLYIMKHPEMYINNPYHRYDDSLNEYKHNIIDQNGKPNDELKHIARMTISQLPF